MTKPKMMTKNKTRLLKLIKMKLKRTINLVAFMENMIAKRHHKTKELNSKNFIGKES